MEDRLKTLPQMAESTGLQANEALKRKIMRAAGEKKEERYFLIVYDGDKKYGFDLLRKNAIIRNEKSGTKLRRPCDVNRPYGSSNH